MTYFANGHVAKSDDAGFIMVSGTESIDFLQSILTANVATIAVGSCRPAALLTPQGRILIDMMLYRLSDQDICLQTDQERAGDLLARLRRYRLRRPVTLEQNLDMHLTLWWGYEGTVKPDDDSIFLDTRHADLGCRIISTSADVPSALNGAKPASYEDWQARRIGQAIPEGAIDLSPERALMLEAGLDKLAAVDFEKGCYIGQEVTARTHYRGLVKRRLLPLCCEGPPPAVGSEIIWQGKVIGTSKTAATCPDHVGHSVALALLKLDDIHAIIDQATATSASDLIINGQAARLCPPAWCLPLPVPPQR
ncbi:MAG: YgfZ/GcvT domain-containing protein [Candidatus Puniceispirillaceae bacterium]